jgi:tetratricopeptide (TPR) repeat protein
MRFIRMLPTIPLLILATASGAQDQIAQLTTAQERYRANDLDGALQQLEPLLSLESLEEAAKQRVRDLAIRVLQVRAEEHFLQARFAKSIADFDRQIQLQPDLEAAHWQLGISYYYAGEYSKGARQFELHRTVNPQDVENAAWHFLCVVRAPRGSVEAARRKLIPVTRDARVPMKQIQEMFAGMMTPEVVLRAGEKAGGTAKFYADLYVGLYYEALDRDDESLRLVKRAAANPATRKNYMGNVAKVHVILRTKSVSSAQLNRPM